MWSNSIAVGSEGVVEMVKVQISIKAKYRETIAKDDAFFIKEPEASYTSHFIGEIDVVSQS
jgi:hypothetical protein